MIVLLSASLGAVSLLAIAPAVAQDHSMHDMTGMTKPAQPTRPAPPAGTGAPQRNDAPAQRDAPARLGTDLQPGTAPAPPAPLPHYADRYWNVADMARGRDIMMRRDGGGRPFAQIMIDIAEAQVRTGRDGYRWQGEGWFGGDIDRFVVKTEGAATMRGAVNDAEVQALYSRAIGPYFNLQAGLRHDIRPRRGRTYATIGIEGLAPYWFEIDAAAFLSGNGDLIGRIEGYYDQRITQRLIVQPRVEIEVAAQDVTALRLGSGLTSAEAGLRLRYEISRQFAPYVGVSWERKLGRTARFARRDGEDSGGAAMVFGIRAWF